MKKLIGILVWLAGVLGTFGFFRIGKPQDPPGALFLAGLVFCSLMAFGITVLIRKWAVGKPVDKCTVLIICWFFSIVSYVGFLFVIALIDGHLAGLLSWLFVIILTGSIMTTPMTLAAITACHLIVPINRPDRDAPGSQDPNHI